MIGFAIVVALFAAAAGGALLVVPRIRRERAETQRVRAIFSRYVPPVVVDQILAREDLRRFQARSGHAAVLVCKIKNFAMFTEDLAPDETLRYLNEFYTLTGSSIQRHRGMIERFTTDGIVGVFGLPIDDPHQEEHAVKAALDIIRLVDGMNARWRTQGRKPFRVGIGINAGTVVAGDVGYAARREYGVVGTEVLVASRLQETTENINAYIVVSGSVYDVTRELFAFVPMASVPLRGMRLNARAYVVRGFARHVAESDLLLPAPSQFKRNTIAPEPRIDLKADAPVADPPPPPPVVAPPPVETAREHVAPEPVDAERAYALPPIELPELQSFGAYDDDKPVLPDPPAPNVLYEDKHGRTLQLPP